eukprot:scaffold1_cov402-Prasinococcus_capsulatus_cf.AAC.10
MDPYAPSSHAISKFSNASFSFSLSPALSSSSSDRREYEQAITPERPRSLEDPTHTGKVTVPPGTCRGGRKPGRARWPGLPSVAPALQPPNSRNLQKVTQGGQVATRLQLQQLKPVNHTSATPPKELPRVRNSSTLRICGCGTAAVVGVPPYH